MTDDGCDLEFWALSNRAEVRGGLDKQYCGMEDTGIRLVPCGANLLPLSCFGFIQP